MELNKIYNDNFLNNNIPDKSVKLIIADPPYFEIKGEFDFIWKSFEDYLADVEKWAKEFKRILADNGSLFFYGDEKKIAYCQIILDKYFELNNSLVWNKGSFMGLEYSESLRSFAPCTERILFYTNDLENLNNSVFFIRKYLRNEIIKSKGKIVFKDINKALGTATNGGGVASAVLSLDKKEPAMITKELYLKLKEYCSPFMSKSYEELRNEFEEKRRYFNNIFNLQEVLNFKNEKRSFNHETPKPEDLSRALILTTTRPKDLVFIPFAGSGTECAMSAKEGRNFIGYEINEKYIKDAQKRVNKYLSQMNIFDLGA